MDSYTVYVAMDGTEFRNENDCLYYENQLKVEHLSNKIKFFTSSRTPVEAENCISIWDQVFYISIPNDVTVDELEDFNNFARENLDDINVRLTRGIWRYSSEIGSWENLIEILAELQNEINKIEAIK